MDYIFYQVAAINGFDSFGHYLRAGLIVNQCSTYAVQPTFGCSANFGGATATAASASVDGPRDQSLVDTANALADALGMPGLKTEPAASREGKRTERATTDRRAPQERRSAPRSGGRAEPAPEDPPAPATPAPAAPAPTATPAPTAAPPPPSAEDQTETLLDYLFGGDGG
jgi:hypothetical protein